jgi:putative oxidoreductase
MNTTSAPRRLPYTVSWIAQSIAAAIMAQTLYFKFSAAAEPVYIFSTLGLEPMGRIGTAVAELAASILLLIPAWSWLGAALGLGLMTGAIFFHLTTLGIVVLDDGGALFGMGCVVFACCAIVLFLRRTDIPFLKGKKNGVVS